MSGLCICPSEMGAGWGHRFRQIGFAEDDGDEPHQLLERILGSEVLNNLAVRIVMDSAEDEDDILAELVSKLRGRASCHFAN